MDCNQDIEAILETESILTDIEMNDVLMNELYTEVTQEQFIVALQM